MDEEMMQMAAMEQALGGGPMSAPTAPPGQAPAAPAEGTGTVTIEVPEFALPYIAELLSSLTGMGPV